MYRNLRAFACQSAFCFLLPSVATASDFLISVDPAIEVGFGTSSNEIYQVKQKRSVDFFESWRNDIPPILGDSLTNGFSFLHSTKGADQQTFQVIRFAFSEFPPDLRLFVPFNNSLAAFFRKPNASNYDGIGGMFVPDDAEHQFGAITFPTNSHFSISPLNLVGSEISIAVRIRKRLVPGHIQQIQALVDSVGFTVSGIQNSADLFSIYVDLRLESQNTRLIGAADYDEWLTVVATHKRPNSNLYINGELVDSNIADTDTFDSNSAIHFARPRTPNSGTVYPIDFDLDDLMIFDRALTDQERAVIENFRF